MDLITELIGGNDKRDGERRRGGIPSWIERIEKLVDASPRYLTALRSSFVRFQTDGLLPPSQLLLALQFLMLRITDELDAKAGRLCLRPVSQEDIDVLLQTDTTLNIDQPIDIEAFDEIARKLLKRIALERGKRLGLFVVGGILVVHVLKGTVKKIPIIGPVIGTAINIIMPTIIVGPAVGIAGAMHL